LGAGFFCTAVAVDSAAFAAVFLVPFLMVLVTYYISILHTKPGIPDARHPASIEPSRIRA